MRIVVALVTITAVAFGASAEAAGHDRSRVRIADMAPLELRGVGFLPREKIRLKVSIGSRTLVRSPQANAAGSFIVEFEALRYDRCQGSLRVSAAGSKGSRVTWELVPLACPAKNDD